jgi:pyroglutamyl-peptidase
LRPIDPIAKENRAAAAPTPARPIVLLTGFGPFPGVPENATALLVPRLARAVRDLYPDYEVVAAILPTEWVAAPQKVGDLLARPGTVLALHFGVSRQTVGFQIELVGRNACRAVADAAGNMPATGCLLDDGPAELACTLPVERILQRLTQLGVPVCTSTDAGGYLCNALLYHSLGAAGTLKKPHLVGFVHLPAELVGYGADGMAPHPDCRLDWRGAMAGSVEIVAACLESLGSAPPVKDG